MTLVIHIIGGGLGLLSGYVALYAAKGASLHRKSGIVFVYSMLTMTTFGALMAATENNNWTSVNVSAASLTSYLVITALTTVRPFAGGSRRLHLGGLLLVSTLALTDLTFGAQAIAAGGRRNGVPAFPFFMFGVVALLATVGDLRVMRSGVLRGASRLRRHLWRMTFALFIAAMSFFFGQAKVIPKPIRIPALLALPVVAVLVTLLYWLWRVRVRRTAIEQPEVRLRAAA
jgi:hypothetical protein